MRWASGLFTASGTQIALDASMPAIVAVLMGMVTAVFGGVLRDIVCNEIPRAFRDHQPYACAPSPAPGWWCCPTQGAPQGRAGGRAATATLLRVLATCSGGAAGVAGSDRPR